MLTTMTRGPTTSFPPLNMFDLDQAGSLTHMGDKLLKRRKAPQIGTGSLSDDLKGLLSEGL